MQTRRVYKRPFFNPDNVKKPRENEADVRHDAHKYLRAHVFIETLRKYTNVLTMQEYRDLRNIALDGDIELAQKKLEIILADKANFRHIGGTK